MNCIVIDDEPRAIDVLKRHIIKTPFLVLLKTFRDPVDAISFLHENQVDLIFLDINMPNLNGIQFLKLLPEKPLFIFTTAYPEHAIEGYELDALDYLLKPVMFDRFLKAVTKAHELSLLKHNAFHALAASENHNNSPQLIFLKSGSQIHKINTSDILYLEKKGNYIMVYIAQNKKLLVRMSFPEIATYLSKDFVRIHKSYIISLKHIELIESYYVVINKVNLPIGASFRDDFIKLINSLNKD